MLVTHLSAPSSAVDPMVTILSIINSVLSTCANMSEPKRSRAYGERINFSEPTSTIVKLYDSLTHLISESTPNPKSVDYTTKSHW